ncbi:MAG TPA: phosphatidate cytidylyltransferase [Rhizomicrobium sp.]|jgi:phosphatidate cytidylyltransferase
MSSAPHVAGRASRKQAVTQQFSDRIQFNMDWITRPLFGFLLAGIAVGATILGGIAFVAFLLLGASGAVREWHRLFTRRDFVLPTAITIVAMTAALTWQLCWTAHFGIAGPIAPFAILLCGAVANALLGLMHRDSPFAHAAGAIYIGLPTLTLLMLRQSPAHPVWLVVLTLLAVWATDTGALISGNMIGGPRLAPVLSPNKTWAGSMGGAVCAALIAGLLALLLHTSVVAAALFGLVLSIAGQFGDLFESLAKRRVGKKDSGNLIPGHGGVLDRIDSVLFAAPVATFIVLVLGLDPLRGLAP